MYDEMSIKDMRYAMSFFEVYLRDHENESFDMDIMMFAIVEHRPDLFQLPRDEKMLYRIACKVCRT